MELPITELALVGRLLVAAILGALIGFERETAGKSAGLRTHALVCTGAAVFTVVSVGGFPGADPARVAAQIVPGIGFLGAGVILHRRGIIRGLTTAAALWITASVGMAVGSALYLVAVAATAVAFVLLRFGPHLGHE